MANKSTAASPAPEADEQTTAKKASASSAPAAAPAPVKTAEAWCKEKGISPSVYAGMLVYYDWAAGKEMTEAAFDQSVKAYLAAPVSRSRA